jgi:hypothetical protein
LAVLAGCTATIAMLKDAQGAEFLKSTGFDFLAIDALGQLHTVDATLK